MSYKVGIGYDVAEIDLVEFPAHLQPHSEGIRVARRDHAVAGNVLGEGVYIDLDWDTVEDATQLAAIYAFFGLDGSISTSNVTVLIPGNMFTDLRYNGIAVRPLIGQDLRRTNYYLRDLTILIKMLRLA